MSQKLDWNRKPMLLSYNEILMTCSKALESLGWAQGDWQDGAESVAWLTLHGLDGVQLLLGDLDNLREPYARELTLAQKHVFDANGQSCLRVGPLVADWCYADLVGKPTADMDDDVSDNRVSHAFLHNCRNPRFLVPYCVTKARRGCLVYLTWQDDADSSTAWQLRVGPFSDQPELGRYALADGAEAVRGFHLLMSFNGDYVLPAPDGELLGMISAEFPQRAQRNLQNGITVSDDDWLALTTLAKGILVPETEASRLRGAGESGG